MNNNPFKQLTVISLLVIFPAMINAQWVQTNMPGGGSILGLATIDSTLFAGTYVGLFRSTDKGESWTSVNVPLKGFHEAYPFAAGTDLFIASNELLGVLYVSHDKGLTWSPAYTGLPRYFTIRDVAKADSIYFALIFNQLFRSDNTGKNWISIDSTGWIEYCLAARDSLVVFGSDKGAFISTDNGMKWTPIISDHAVTACAINDSVIIANVDYNVISDSTIRVSTDNGASWTSKLNEVRSSPLLSFKINDTNIYCQDPLGSVYCSADYGTSWSSVYSVMPEILEHENWNTLISYALCGKDFFIGKLFDRHGGGVFRSIDNGKNWNPVNSGLTGYSVNALASIDTTIIAATGIGIFASNDNGHSWNMSGSGLPASSGIKTLAVKGNDIFAGTELIPNDSCGLYISHDHGGSWTNIFPFPSSIIDSQSSDTTSGPSGYGINSIAIHGDCIFIGAEGEGIFYSNDNGAHWRLVGNEVLWQAGNGVSSLAFMNADLFVGIGRYVFRSIDSSRTWTNSGFGLPDTTWWDPIFRDNMMVNITTLGVQGTNLFAGTGSVFFKGSGIYLSTDSGTAWKPVNTGLPAHASIRKLLAIDTQVFAATDTSGIFVSNDTGKSWHSIDFDLPANISITSLLANASMSGLPKTGSRTSGVSNPYLFAGTSNSGVWRLPLSNAQILDKPGNLRADQQPKIRIASMRSRCRVSYTITSSCFVTLSLYSISGKLLSTIVNKAQSPGNYTAAISHNVAAGFYVLKFKAGNYELINKLLLQ